MEKGKPSFVYCLQCTNGRTYVGATVDLDRRLKQHNGILSGGATATTSQVKEGQSWKRICYVKNFPDWRSALQFEWRWKQITRKISQGNGLERRKKALERLLALEKPTSSAIPYATWEEPPTIVWESETDLENVGLN